MKKVFYSDPELGEYIYKKIRRCFTRYKIGIFAVLLLLSGFIYDMYNMYLWIDFGCDMANIMIHIGIAFVIIAFLIYSFLFLLSGGRKELVKRKDEYLSVYNDHLEMIYSYNKMLYKNVIYFCDIEELFYEIEKKRLRICSDCLILSAATEQELNNDAKQTEKDGVITYVYAKYPEFESVLTLLQELSLKKIQSNSQFF